MKAQRPTDGGLKARGPAEPGRETFPLSSRVARAALLRKRAEIRGWVLGVSVYMCVWVGGWVGGELTRAIPREEASQPASARSVWADSAAVESRGSGPPGFAYRRFSRSVVGEGGGGGKGSVSRSRRHRVRSFARYRVRRENEERERERTCREARHDRRFDAWAHRIAKRLKAALTTAKRDLIRRPWTDTPRTARPRRSKLRVSEAVNLDRLRRRPINVISKGGEETRG